VNRRGFLRFLGIGAAAASGAALATATTPPAPYGKCELAAARSVLDDYAMIDKALAEYHRERIDLLIRPAVVFPEDWKMIL